MKSPKIWFVVFLGFVSAGCGEKPLTQFNSPGGKFSVMFPGEPKTQNVVGQNNVSVTVYSVESFSWAYIVTHYDLPALVHVAPNNLTELLNAEIDGAFKGAQGKKESSKPVRSQDKHDGMEFAGTWTKPKNVNVRGRMFIVNNRMFNVMVMGNADKVNSEIATQFLDSFKAN